MAQQSAQATMKVQVTVVEGNAITLQQREKIELEKADRMGDMTELSTLRLIRKPGSVLMLNRSEKMNLSSDRGQHLQIPVIYHDEETEEGITSKMNITSFPDNTLTGSTYKGTIKTSVAYL
ncbi:MAG: hypothetical protein R3222_06790 [Balneolaceae bacterium]|nr:hypothetical protein [Balneolaceae bacterium]